VAARVFHVARCARTSPLALSLIFIEHTNELSRCRPISTLIRLVSNHAGLNPIYYDCLLDISPQSYRQVFQSSKPLKCVTR
jgi:hypothetical protein